MARLFSSVFGVCFQGGDVSSVIKTGVMTEEQRVSRTGQLANRV